MKSGGILIMLKGLSPKGFHDGENGSKIFELINSKYGASIHSNSVIPWTIQSMEFSRLEFWSGEPFPSPEEIPDPGVEPRSPALQVDTS